MDKTFPKEKFLAMLELERWTAKTVKPLPHMLDMEVRAAGTLLAISNCGFLSTQQEKDLFNKHRDMEALLRALDAYAYSMFDNDDAWNGYQAERCDWIKKFRERDTYCLHEWYTIRYKLAGLLPSFLV